MKIVFAGTPDFAVAPLKKIQENGFDVQVRLSPFIPELVDIDVINYIKCKLSFS